MLDTLNAALTVCCSGKTKNQQPELFFFMQPLLHFIYFHPRKPKKQPPELFSFMHPLSLDVWIYIVVAYFIVSFLLFILARSAV